ncbi:hypothetical protein KSS87_015285 [Heliosperma pusillum]|nr:hypothetical protein KSS87_015285 [Heliosperma pusillum]
MGNGASMLLYGAPVLTFSTIVRKKSTQEFSCVPYIVALLNCLIYTWYGLPIVSCGWENFPLITTNGLGILLESSFIIIYLWFASTSGKKQVIETKSVKYMPFYLSFFSFLTSSIWMAYGILSHDLFLMSPCLVGCVLAIIQLVLYCKYRDRRVPEETSKWDVEKNEEGTKQVELVTDSHVNT